MSARHANDRPTVFPWARSVFHLTLAACFAAAPAASETIFSADFEDGTTCDTWTMTFTFEVCDGVDNDCDGVADEGDPGGGEACTTGLEGRCSDGTTACLDGALQCSQNHASSPEVCNGLDDDCDGVPDDGNPGGGGSCSTGLPGVCSAGTLTCDGGELACQQNQSSSPEVCDGLDNDCDGVADEGCP